MRKPLLILLAICFIWTMVPTLSAQTTSSTASVQITATKSESLTVTAAPSGSNNFNLDNPLTGQTVAISVGAHWNIKPSRTYVNICAQMAGNMTGIAGNSGNITPSYVLASAPGNSNTPAAMTTAITNCGGWAQGVLVNHYPVATQADRVRTTDTSDTLTLSLSNSLNVGALEADTYTGNVNIVAATY
jgi:hypothetical protein